jgi:hypothetical protein
MGMDELMARRGLLSLGDIAITAAGTYLGDWYDNLDGMSGFTYQCRFAYGSGGTSCRVYLQSSFDQETTSVDLDCHLFQTTSDVLLLSFDGQNVVTRSGSPATGHVATDGALADYTSVDGLMGDRLRVKIITTGTYGGSTVVSPRVIIR